MPCIPIPAIDIRGGRCVRLLRGDFRRETRYSDDPIGIARRWQAEGAARLHVVDLDGARDGTRANSSIIGRLIGAVSIPVQVGGGVRTLEDARALLETGADRIVIGTAAVQEPTRIGEWLHQLGAERVIVAVDARDGRVASHGWQTSSDLDVHEFCQLLAGLGVERVLYTDVDRDGTLGGPDVAGTRDLARVVRVLASGGIATTEHLRALAAAGAEGAIIGTALYDGRLRLGEALAAC
ncbi:MAG: 1-(5-phosphoribosyl)-5-[(5-phosphoribosylamino)methylideneamino]imidazole-4-carboxamide isomerase [Chloroflexota bacterium]|nr:1-(5-phosphoribosyl)-5-[(5-phosphoribosylamino)methylideneamino]imidazole-4-carboxamide isomerase [Chloroflexota bacterium]